VFVVDSLAQASVDFLALWWG